MKYLLFGFLFLSACATVKPSFVRNGKQVYEAQCDGAGRTIATCHELAAKQCDGRYDELGGEPGGFLQRRSLLFTCQDEQTAKAE